MRFFRRWMTLPVLLLASVSFAQEAADVVEEAHNPGAFLDSIIFGIEIAVVGMVAVFLGLVAVFFVMSWLKKLSEPKRKKRTAGEAVAEEEQPEISAEVAHAIALALFMDLRTFEEEAAHEITIRKITRPYSPWWHSGKMRLVNDQVQIFRKW
ncbi:OadG family protein [bacterium]|nr:OadG family protein [bacterium]